METSAGISQLMFIIKNSAGEVRYAGPMNSSPSVKF